MKVTESSLNAQTTRTGTLENMNQPWERVLHLATRRVYPKKFPLNLSGDALYDFYYLARGKIRIMQATEQGRERAMLYILKGALFNEASALAGFDNDNSSFYCMEEAELYRFSGKLLHDRRFVRDYPDLIINLLISMGTKLLVMHVNLSGQGDGTALRQVSRYLLSLSQKNGDGLLFVTGMTQEETAIFLGMDRTTLVRALSRLRDLGVLSRFTKTGVEIADLERLRAVASDQKIS